MSEATVYVVDCDVVQYRSLLYDLPEHQLAQVPDLVGTPTAASWPSPPVYIDNYDEPSPDVWHLTTIGKALVMTPAVIRRLEPFVSMAGELLVLRNNTGEEWDFFVLNVLKLLDHKLCIDTSHGAEERKQLLAKYADYLSSDDYDGLLRNATAGDPYPVLYPAFIPDCLVEEPTFFRVDRLTSTLFLLDRDSDDTLLRRIERLGITGLVFDKVWSSETGPENINLFRR